MNTKRKSKIVHEFLQYIIAYCTCMLTLKTTNGINLQSVRLFVDLSIVAEISSILFVLSIIIITENHAFTIIVNYKVLCVVVCLPLLKVFQSF